MTEQTHAPEPSERQQMGNRLLNNKVRFHHWPPGSGIPCTRVCPNGDVGLQGISGEFAPHLFDIDGEVLAVPLEGTVS